MHQLRQRETAAALRGSLSPSSAGIVCSLSDGNPLIVSMLQAFRRLLQFLFWKQSCRSSCNVRNGFCVSNIYVYLCFCQEEYVSEGLQWSFVKYQNNQSCLDLIEGSPVSVFSLLNEVRCSFSIVIIKIITKTVYKLYYFHKQTTHANNSKNTAACINQLLFVGTNSSQ